MSWATEKKQDEIIELLKKLIALLERPMEVKPNSLAACGYEVRRK